MKRGLTGDNVGLSSNQQREAQEMLYAGLDLSRQRLDVHVLDEEGRTVEVTAVRPDSDARRTLVSHVQRHGQEVSAAIESMTGARFVHDQLELAGWDVAIGDAAKVKGIAPLAAGPGGPGRAGAGPLPSPPRPPSDGIEEPHPRHAHHLRPSGAGR
jgi:hypothetical protein